MPNRNVDFRMLGMNSCLFLQPSILELVHIAGRDAEDRENGTEYVRETGSENS